MSESEPTLLNRDQLLAPSARRYAVVGPLPVRGGFVRVQSLTEQEAAAYEAASYDRGSLVRARLEDSTRRYIAMVVVDQSGNRLLSPADVPKLAAWDRADMTFVYSEARAHVDAKRKPLEDIEKNSGATPGGD